MATGLENLKIYQMAEELEIYIHQITKTFPPDEKFRSVDQLRRSSSSVTDNISESYGRFSYGEKIYHMYVARGEAEETKSNYSKCYKKGFVNKESAEYVNTKYTDLIKGINGYIRFLKKQKDKNSKT